MGTAWHAAQRVEGDIPLCTTRLCIVLKDIIVLFLASCMPLFERTQFFSLQSVVRGMLGRACGKHETHDVCATLQVTFPEPCGAHHESTCQCFDCRKLHPCPGQHVLLHERLDSFDAAYTGQGVGLPLVSSGSGRLQ